jgi:hypothetical protein
VLTGPTIANADLSLPFVTKETFEREMAKFRRQQIRHVALAALFGIGTVILGTLLEGTLAFGLLCLLAGPIRAIYTLYAEAR